MPRDLPQYIWVTFLLGLPCLEAVELVRQTPSAWQRLLQPSLICHGSQAGSECSSEHGTVCSYVGNCGCRLGSVPLGRVPEVRQESISVGHRKMRQLAQVCFLYDSKVLWTSNQLFNFNATWAQALERIVPLCSAGRPFILAADSNSAVATMF